MIFIFEHSLHVKFIVNDVIEVNFHKQAVDLLSTVVNLRYEEELLQKSRIFWSATDYIS